MSLENKTPNPSKKLKDAWNTQADEYWEYKEGERAKFPIFFEDFYMFHKADFKNVLDIGCGSGKFLIPMVQDGLNVTGLDISHKMIESAEKNLERAKLKGKARFLEGESKKLSLPNESFDFVIAKGSIHHNTWKDIQESFKEVSRVLRTKKFFLFQARSINDSGVYNAEKIEDMGHTTQDKEGWKEGVIQHYFTKEELVQLALENGLEIVLGPQEINYGNGKTRLWVVYRKI